MLKMVKQDLWFLPFVAREMQGTWKGDEREKIRSARIVKFG